jgi:hypothetical protein
VPDDLAESPAGEVAELRALVERLQRADAEHRRVIAE